MLTEIEVSRTDLANSASSKEWDLAYFEIYDRTYLLVENFLAI